MSSGWHWWVIVLTAANILACWWLIAWSAGQGDDSKDANDTLDHVWDEDLQERNQPLPRWWLMLFHATIVFSIVYLVLYPGMGNYAGTLGWTQVAQYQSERDAIDEIYAATFSTLAALPWDELANNERAHEIGANLYAGSCATCHGSDGGGAPGFPSLKDGDWLYGGDFDSIAASISNGRSGMMAPMAPALEGMGVSVADMVEKVKALAGAEHDAQAAVRAQPGYVLCMACHGPEGKGNPALGAPDLSDDIWLYGGSNAAIEQTLVQGRNGQMPPHKELLTEDQIKVLAGYVGSGLSGR
jgi:cytochrome c oxidase cbb3-type subunit 3